MAAAMGLMGDAGFPLLLSTLAGLSTSIGAAIAVTHIPGEDTLAFLLGSAIGVMATVAGIELWLHNALRHNALWVTVSVVIGAAAFCGINPLLPKLEPEQLEDEIAEQSEQGKGQPLAPVSSSRKPKDTLVARAAATRHQVTGATKPSPSSSTSSTPRHTGAVQAAGSAFEQQALLPAHAWEQTAVFASDSMADGLEPQAAQPARNTTGLMRLGIIMAVTLTLHNLPEGVAVAFSALGQGRHASFALVLAIAVHNVPEGIVIAAPIYAATNSRWRAVGIATASGLSEPAGALLALLLLRPFVTSLQQLDYVLAFVGGVMLAVCAVELWPEARRCRHDMRMAQGIILGACVMGWTLWLGA